MKKTISNYGDIKPIQTARIQKEEVLRNVCIFHDASISTIGVLIYLEVENVKKQTKVSKNCLSWKKTSPK